MMKFESIDPIVLEFISLIENKSLDDKILHCKDASKKNYDILITSSMTSSDILFIEITQILEKLFEFDYELLIQHLCSCLLPRGEKKLSEVTSYLFKIPMLEILKEETGRNHFISFLHNFQIIDKEFFENPLVLISFLFINYVHKLRFTFLVNVNPNLGKENCTTSDFYNFILSGIVMKYFSETKTDYELIAIINEGPQFFNTQFEIFIDSYSNNNFMIKLYLESLKYLYGSKISKLYYINENTSFDTFSEFVDKLSLLYNFNPEYIKLDLTSKHYDSRGNFYGDNFPMNLINCIDLISGRKYFIHKETKKFEISTNFLKLEIIPKNKISLSSGELNENFFNDDNKVAFLHSQLSRLFDICRFNKVKEYFLFGNEFLIFIDGLGGINKIEVRYIDKLNFFSLVLNIFKDAHFPPIHMLHHTGNFCFFPNDKNEFISKLNRYQIMNQNYASASHTEIYFKLMGLSNTMRLVGNFNFFIYSEKDSTNLDNYCTVYNAFYNFVFFTKSRIYFYIAFEIEETLKNLEKIFGAIGEGDNYKGIQFHFITKAINSIEIPILKFNNRRNLSQNFLIENLTILDKSISITKNKSHLRIIFMRHVLNFENLNFLMEFGNYYQKILSNILELISTFEILLVVNCILYKIRFEKENFIVRRKFLKNINYLPFNIKDKMNDIGMSTSLIFSFKKELVQREKIIYTNNEIDFDDFENFDTLKKQSFKKINSKQHLNQYLNSPLQTKNNDQLLNLSHIDIMPNFFLKIFLSSYEEYLNQYYSKKTKLKLDSFFPKILADFLFKLNYIHNKSVQVVGFKQKESKEEDFFLFIKQLKTITGPPYSNYSLFDKISIIFTKDKESSDLLKYFQDINSIKENYDTFKLAYTREFEIIDNFNLKTSQEISEQLSEVDKILEATSKSRVLNQNIFSLLFVIKSKLNKLKKNSIIQIISKFMVKEVKQNFYLLNEMLKITSEDQNEKLFINVKNQDRFYGVGMGGQVSEQEKNNLQKIKNKKKENCNIY
jgi:hypothetical protein